MSVLALNGAHHIIYGNNQEWTGLLDKTLTSNNTPKIGFHVQEASTVATRHKIGREK